MSAAGDRTHRGDSHREEMRGEEAHPEGTTTAPDFPTAIGTSTADAMYLLGHDVAGELMGEVEFGELGLWLMTRERPTKAQSRVFNAVMAALADHGFTPTAIAARMTFYSAPDAIQGALASGLLGGGSRFLGVTEDTGRFLHQALEDARRSGRTLETDDDYLELARTLVAESRAAGKFVPGVGHPVHKTGDPRTPALMRVAREEGVYGQHLRLFNAIGQAVPEVLGKSLPLNGAGVCGAALADLGVPLELLRGAVLLARCAGLLGHLGEELKQPAAPEIYRLVDRNARYQPPENTDR